MITSELTLFEMGKTKIEEAQEILKYLGMPIKQQNELAALTFLALCSIKEIDTWDKATATSKKLTKDIMAFVNLHYGKKYAPNTRETFRRQVLHQLIDAKIVLYNPDIPELPVNSSRTHYKLSNEVIKVVKSYKTIDFETSLKEFKDNFGSLSLNYDKARDMEMIPITLDGIELKLSPGKHNEVQKSVIHEFGPRFAPGAELLYLGDTENKFLYSNDSRLKEIGLPIDKHSKLPDIVMYMPERNWLFLIEVVTAHGPISQKRINELEILLCNSIAEKIYITAFPNKAEFRKHITDIAWETEVWIADNPGHMIHFNGDKFLGPYSS